MKKPIFEAVAVTNDGKPATSRNPAVSYEVRAKIGKKWFTIADCYAVDSKGLDSIGGGDAPANAGLIARLLNDALGEI